MKGLRRDPERTELRALRRRIPLEGARILEVGCGDGRLTRRIAPVARAVAAIDSNEAFIARAKALTPASLRKKVRYGLAVAESLRLPGRRFDVAILSWSL